MRGAERHEDGGDDVVDEVEEGGEEQAQVLAQPSEALLGIQTENQTGNIESWNVNLLAILCWIDFTS